MGNNTFNSKKTQYISHEQSQLVTPYLEEKCSGCYLPATRELDLCSHVPVHCDTMWPLLIVPSPCSRSPTFIAVFCESPEPGGNIILEQMENFNVTDVFSDIQEEP